VEIHEGTKVGQMLERLNVPVESVKMIFLNGIHAEIDTALKDGDRVGVFPPVAGG
jgi:molybdopterin converting factor small subunit